MFEFYRNLKRKPHLNLKLEIWNFFSLFLPWNTLSFSLFLLSNIVMTVKRSFSFYLSFFIFFSFKFSFVLFFTCNSLKANRELEVSFTDSIQTSFSFLFFKLTGSFLSTSGAWFKRLCHFRSADLCDLTSARQLSSLLCFFVKHTPTHPHTQQ